MSQDRSKKVGSQPRTNRDGASGRTGNALGPKHMMGDPQGRSQLRDAPSQHGGYGQYKASGKRGNPRTLGQQAALPRVVLVQNLAGQTFDFKPFFENYGAGAGTWVSTIVPTGMTLNSTTGILSGTPTALQTGSPILTVLTGSVGTPPASVAASWSFTVAA